jgi:hypothetical protein
LKLDVGGGGHEPLEALADGLGSRWYSDHELPLSVNECSTLRLYEAPGDGETQARPASLIEADEALESAFFRPGR